MTEPVAIPPSPGAAWTAQLVAAGHLVPMGVPGLHGLGGDATRIALGVERLVASASADDGAEVLRFPPVIARATLERSDYLATFPHLAGSVHSFSGSERDHARLLDRLESGGGWADGLPSTGTVLTPAACYPLYPTLAGTLPPEGRLVDLSSYVFRHEPSDDPARMQSFRMCEQVRAGTAEQCRAHRDRWLERGLGLLRSLGLDAHAALANDPFFGRAGRMLASNQREQQLKFELLVPVTPGLPPTACASFNYHQDHFGLAFGIRTRDGAPAHTACVGFGLERLALALLRRHGLDVAAWPAAVRAPLLE
ncbi:MAG TPA: amino acid--[acyl-carrier-protein] ligase [Gemmatimonadales bacterium]|nr:amino acid--[acyl-carrier-protein] ligase [Gemmatimonadales bacterium]